MLPQCHNPEAYVPEGCRYHRRYSLQLQCDPLHAQLPEMHKLMRLLPNLPQVPQHRLQVLQFSARRYPLSDWSDVRKYFRHPLIRNGQQHAESGLFSAKGIRGTDSLSSGSPEGFRGQGLTIFGIFLIIALFHVLPNYHGITLK